MMNYVEICSSKKSYLDGLVLPIFMLRCVVYRETTMVDLYW